MKVKAEMCFAGNNKHQCRLTFYGKRYTIDVPEETWCRAVAIRAKDLVSSQTGCKRKNIRFV